jgi:hypothetical protein
VQPALIAFLARIGGRRTYGQIAEDIGCLPDALLSWGGQLQSLYVVE